MEGAFSPALENITIREDAEDEEVRTMVGALSSALEDITIIDEEEDEEEQEYEDELEDESCKNNRRSNACEELDASIWSNLPGDILERVLAHLPVACLARARTVCKKLNQIILSNNFLSAQADLAPPRRESWFAMFQTEECSKFSAYDPDLNRWYEIPLSFLPCQVRGVASAGGLLCCRGEMTPGLLALLVCNPMTKKCGVLPPMLRRRLVPVVSMQLFHHHFKVLVAGDDLHPDGRSVSDLTCEVFDSRTNRWTLSGSIPPNSELELGSAICNGNLYLLTNSSSPSLCGVLSFNLQHGVWSKVQAPMPRNLTIPSLVECSGRLFMVGGVVKKIKMASVRVWELCERSMAWKEVARMKDRMFRELSDKKELYFTAVGHGNLICILIFQSTQMLALDIRTRSWFWLPRYASAGGSESRTLLGYPFNPNLYTVV
uniref:F-box domain-containing protein n=1 Tax=Araucaria cunninghamii TaxID=56994 RepID=A0A0D6QWF5_ARACU